MYNFIIPCSLSYIIVSKYCHVGASLSLAQHIVSAVSLLKTMKTAYFCNVWLSLEGIGKDSSNGLGHMSTGANIAFNM